MKRFKVRNLLNGLQFQIEAHELPNPLPPEWGRPSRSERDDNGIETVFPPEHEILEEDITEEVQARVDRIIRSKQRKKDLFDLAGKNSLTPAEVQSAVLMLLKDQFGEGNAAQTDVDDEAARWNAMTPLERMREAFFGGR
jgi:hypothetical protein